MRAERFGSYSIVASAGRHAELVALEVDAAVVLLLAAAAMADGEAALVVAAGAADLRLEQRLVRLAWW